MVGMNDDSFPRIERRAGFDLMQSHRRNSDPSIKNEDRYMFLEALISASDKLYISYIGRSVTDNSEQLPSVVVSELTEYIDRNYCTNDDRKESVSSSLSVKHPLHGFSSEYFTAKSDSDKQLRLFSYSEENCNISQLLSCSATEKKPYLLDFGEEFPEIEDKIMTIDDLVGFFQNPSKTLLRKRLDVNLDVFLKEELNDKRNY